MLQWKVFLRRKVARPAGAGGTCTCASTGTGLCSKSNNTSALPAKQRDSDKPHKWTSFDASNMKNFSLLAGKPQKKGSRSAPLDENNQGVWWRRGQREVDTRRLRLIRVRLECCHHPKCHFTTDVITVDFHAFLNIIKGFCRSPQAADRREQAASINQY